MIPLETDYELQNSEQKLLEDNKKTKCTNCQCAKSASAKSASAKNVKNVSKIERINAYLTYLFSKITANKILLCCIVLFTIFVTLFLIYVQWFDTGSSTTTTSTPTSMSVSLSPIYGMTLGTTIR